MQLTQAQEMMLLRKYKPYLVSLARDYCNHVSLPFSDCLDDLIQEARIAFLRHIRRIESEDDIYLCKIHVLSAMSKYKESMHVVRIAHNAYAEHKDKSTRVSVDERDRAVTSEETEVRLHFEEFLGTLNQEERDLLTLKEQGYRNREICAQVKMSDSKVSRLLKALREKFYSFHHCED